MPCQLLPGLFCRLRREMILFLIFTIFWNGLFKKFIVPWGGILNHHLGLSSSIPSAPEKTRSKGASLLKWFQTVKAARHYLLDIPDLRRNHTLLFFPHKIISVREIYSDSLFLWLQRCILNQLFLKLYWISFGNLILSQLSSPVDFWVGAFLLSSLDCWASSLSIQIHYLLRT